MPSTRAYVQKLSGEMPIWGARRVENLIPTWDLGNAAWIKSAAGVASAPVVTTGYAPGPDGVAASAARVQYDCGALGSSADDSRLRVELTSLSVKKAASAWLRSNDGNNHTLFFRSSNGSITIEVTPAWTRFAYTETDEATRFWLTLRGDAAFSQTADILVATGNGFGPQLEFLAGMAWDAPGESVNPAVDYGFGVAGVRYFPWKNGNSVNVQGVVTEAQGAQISDILGLRPLRAATNLAAYSDISDYSGSGANIAAANPLPGFPSCSKFTKTVAGSVLGFNERPPIGDDVGVMAFIIEQGSEPIFDVGWRNFDQSTFYGSDSSTITFADLSVQNNGDGGTSIEVEELLPAGPNGGKVVLVIVRQTGMSTTEQNQAVMYPSGRVGFSSSGQIAYVHHAELRLGSTIWDAPIVTAGAAASRLRDELTISSIFPNNAFSGLIEVEQGQDNGINHYLQIGSGNTDKVLIFANAPPQIEVQVQGFSGGNESALIGQHSKLAFGCDGSKTVVAADGSVRTTVTLSPEQPPNSIAFAPIDGDVPQGFFRKVAAFSVSLTESQLKAVTS